MNTTKISIVTLALSLAFNTKAQAQIFDDWEARPHLSLEYQFNKDWSIAGTYYLYLDNNMSQYDKSVAGAEIEYKVNSWLEASIDYRYEMEDKGNYHDIRFSVTFDYNPSKKWKIEYRPMFQQEFISLKEEHREKNPIEYFLRNRFTVTYDLTGGIELYVFTENYLQPVEEEMKFHRQKSALGAEFEIGKRSKIETRFEVINKRSGKMIARPNLSYTYTLGYVK